MADYIYLLETRLSPSQQTAIRTVRSIARENDVTVFLTGGAVRDLTGGGSVRDLDLTIQGDALRLKQPLQAAGAIVIGEYSAAQRLFLTFPGSVRVEVSSAMRVTYPTPGKPVFEPSNISEDLRSRDFTANAMAISLNEGSYGLLMDPLNGVADIENRELRLVNNYGFIEEPSRLFRAARLISRLGWQMEERTRQRYDTAKDENYVSALNEWNRGYEAEEIFHEEDPLRVLRALEAEGWSKHLLPALHSEKANVAALGELADKQGQLQVQGIFAQPAALAFPLMIAKLQANEAAALKGMFVRPGFAAQIDSIDAQVREFASRIAGKEAASPSAAWKILHEAEPNLVLALYANSKTAAVQTRLKTFLNDSPGARQRIPYALLQEMRITPDLPEYQALLDKLFFELMDGKLATTEEMKAFLEPYSPPAPPPPVNLRRAKAKKEARPSRAKAKKSVEPDQFAVDLVSDQEAVGVDIALVTEDLTEPDIAPEVTLGTALLDETAPDAVTDDVDTDAEEPDEEALPSAPVSASELEVAPVPERKVAPLPVSVETSMKKAAKKAIPAPVEEPKAAAAKKIVSAVKAVPVAAKTVQKTAKPQAGRKSAPEAVTKTAVKAPAKAPLPPKSAASKAGPPLTKHAPLKAAAKKLSAAKKAVAAKKSAPLKQAAAPKKAIPAKKTATVTKKAAPPAKKSSPVAKKVAAPVKASSAAKKSSAKSAGKKAAVRSR